MTIAVTEGDNTVTSTASYKDFVLTNVKDGRAEKVSIASSESVSTDGTSTTNAITTDGWDLKRTLELVGIVAGDSAGHHVAAVPRPMPKAAPTPARMANCTVGRPFHSTKAGPRPCSPNSSAPSSSSPPPSTPILLAAIKTAVSDTDIRVLSVVRRGVGASRLQRQG